MNAISLYVSASRLLFQSDTQETNYSDLYRLVPYLRQSLSCTVCANLLVEPYSPQDVCQHHVCKECIGGRKNLKPTCTSCRNYQNYQPNSQMRILLQCYKALCKHILNTPVIYSSMHKYVHVDGFVNGNNGARNLAELIDEGARFHDDYKSNSGLPKSAFSILPCIFTSTSQTNHQNTMTNASPAITVNKTQQTPEHSSVSSTTSIVASAASTETKNSISIMSGKPMLPNPPIKTVSNGTALYSVMYAGNGNKITIKRKTDDGTHGGKNLSAKDVLNILNATKTTTNNTNHSLSVNSMTSTHSIKQIHPVQQIITTQKPQTQQIITSQSQTQSQQFHQQNNKTCTIFQPNVNYTLSTSTVQQSQQQQQHQQNHQQQQIQSQQHVLIHQNVQNFKKPTTSKPAKPIQKRKGCRCGNATPTPGKLTCCGQRCPCYVDSKSCVDCKCRGCRNPHRIDGLKVRPQIPELTCFVQMNNSGIDSKNYINIPMDSFSTANARIKEEPISNQIMQTTSNQHVDMGHETIEYMPNELEDANIQVVNVYTTHMPEISSTLPTIIMQDESVTNTLSSSTSTIRSRISVPGEQPPLSLLGDDPIKQSYSDDACSSEERSDIEIDI